MRRYGSLPQHIKAALTALRGTGNTLPFACYDTEAEYQKFLDDASVVPYAYDQPAMGRLWARASIDAAACARKQSKTGALISTAFTARDFKSVAEALGEADRIKYWGRSRFALLMHRPSRA